MPILRAASAALLMFAAQAAVAQEDGRKLFTTVAPACSVCHALKDAGATGEIGPSLDELKPDHDRVVKVLRTGLGQMPAFTHLTEEQVQAIARYVVTATK